MYRNALAEDRAHLSPQLLPTREVPIPKGDDFFGPLRGTPRMRSFEEHKDALYGLPTDAVQLYLRSELMQDEFPSDDDMAAAIIKTRHDIHLWIPLKKLGLSRSFLRHREALEHDLELMKRTCVKNVSPSLKSFWQDTWNQLNAALA